jgi:hypothetical protein
MARLLRHPRFRAAACREEVELPRCVERN